MSYPDQTGVEHNGQVFVLLLNQDGVLDRVFTQTQLTIFVGTPSNEQIFVYCQFGGSVSGFGLLLRLDLIFI